MQHARGQYRGLNTRSEHRERGLTAKHGCLPLLEGKVAGLLSGRLRGLLRSREGEQAKLLGHTAPSRRLCLLCVLVPQRRCEAFG